MAAEDDYTREYYWNYPSLKTCTALLVDNIKQSLLYSGDNLLDIDAEVAQVGSFWEGVANLVAPHSSKIEFSDVLPWINDYNLEAARRDGYLMHVLKSSDGEGYCICYSRYYGNGNWLTPFVHYFSSKDLFDGSLSILYWNGCADYPGLYRGSSGRVYPLNASSELTRMQYETVNSREYSILLTNGAGGYAQDAGIELHEPETNQMQNRVLTSRYSDLVVGDEVSDGVVDEIRELINEGERNIYKAWAYDDKLALREREGFKAIKFRYLDDGPLTTRRIVIMYNSTEDKRRVDLRMFQNIDDALTFLNRHYGKKVTEDWFRLV